MISSSKIISKNPGTLSKMVVFLHGYGASGDDLISLSSSWEDHLPPTVFVAPNGPEACDANIFGYQWFGLPDFSPTNMRLGLDRVRPVLLNYLSSLLNEHQMSPQDLALVGFSQGTIVALEMMFAMPTLNCVLGYSGAFFPPPPSLCSLPSTKVMLIHGNMDTVVPYMALFQSQAQLKELKVEAETYTCHGIAHTINNIGLEVGGQFLSRNFNNTK
ncbi:MAG: alpha/beta fold hydrolase [Alphaproteobacteria bacterium]|nr:alpha/beta fold hydrolase [Alphaproteobacteria bacterium]